jgi:hypothetical protein
MSQLSFYYIPVGFIVLKDPETDSINMVIDKMYIRKRSQTFEGKNTFH